MKRLDLGRDSINKLLFSFSLPCVISMIINSIYNIVDQIFIGKGVGTLGNAATNVIFPLVIIFNAFAGLIGNGAAANLSLRLGEGNRKEASKSVGQSIVLIFIISIILCILSYVFLPKLVYLFGCTSSVYKYAVDYGRIIVLGAPAVIIYSSLSSIIRADGSPKYSMIMLLVGAIINIILDPIFIFGFDMGVKGGAIATVIGQVVSLVMSLVYLRKFKSVSLKRDDFKLDKDALKIVMLGASSFITQCTILVLFIFMNNMMTKYGALTKFGRDIPLSVYGVISKVNSLYISCVLGISIGAQPIIGYNYGAGNENRVKETLKKVLFINFIIGILFNVLLFCFPREIAGIFISSSDASYSLFMEFAVLMCHTFLAVICLNALEMTGSIVIQSLGKVKKATALSFIRQIVLFIPLSLILAIVFDKGIYGILYAGLVSDVLCFIVALFIVGSEYRRLDDSGVKENSIDVSSNKKYDGDYVVVTIAREYASGGRYVGRLLADRLGTDFYDKELIDLAAKESGLSTKYISGFEERKRTNSTDDMLFIAESKAIKKAAKKSCVIVGRCANYVLRDNKHTLNVFLYSDDDSKIKRAVKYYGIDKERALKEIIKIDKSRSKYYKFYTGNDWKDIHNYDLMINVDKYGVDECANYLAELIRNKVIKK